MNTLVQTYRQISPNDPKSDFQIMQEFATKWAPEELAQYPDFLTEWQQAQQQQRVEESSIGTEARRGLGRGVTGLETSALGGVALAADYLGADRLKNWALESRQRKLEQSAEEEPASVPTIQQATQSLPALGQYVAGKAGELVPNVGEALGAAAVGTLVAPGPGTVGGVAGVFLRSAAKAAIKREVEKGIGSAAIRSVVKKELADFAEGKIEAAALSDATKGVVGKMASYKAATAASMANFAALGAGGGYGELSGTPGVSPEAARTGALIAGAGASLGALIPTQILKGIFGESIGEEAARSYVDLYAKKIPTELLTAGSGMGAMEFFNVISEHYADPKKQGKDFSKDDYSRILNAAATGVLAGLPSGGISALRGVKAPAPVEVTGGKAPPATPPPAPETPPVAPPSAPGAGLEVNYPVPDEARKDMRLMANADVAGEINPEEVEAYLAKNPGYRPTYQQIKSEVQDATKARQKPADIQTERPRTDEELQQASQDRVQPAVEPEKGAQAGVSDSLQQATGKLAEYQSRVKDAADSGRILPIWGPATGTRPTVFVKIGNGYLPFYRSSMGTGGAKKAGEWQPFFGFGDNAWLIKGDSEQIKSDYGIPEITAAKKWLNENFNWPHEMDTDLVYNADRSPLNALGKGRVVGQALEQLLGASTFEHVKAETGGHEHIQSILEKLGVAKSPLTEAARGLEPEKKAALESIGISQKEIEAWTATAQAVPTEEFTPIDFALRGQRAENRMTEMLARARSAKEVKPSVEEIKTQEKGDEGRVLTKPTTAAVPEAAAYDLKIIGGLKVPVRKTGAGVPSLYAAYRAPVEVSDNASPEETFVAFYLNEIKQRLREHESQTGVKLSASEAQNFANKLSKEIGVRAGDRAEAVLLDIFSRLPEEVQTDTLKAKIKSQADSIRKTVSGAAPALGSDDPVWFKAASGSWSLSHSLTAEGLAILDPNLKGLDLDTAATSVLLGKDVREFKTSGVPSTPTERPALSDVPKTAAATAETTWLSNVGNVISAWRTPRSGKEETDMYSDLGRDPKNKSRTRTLGVFRSTRSGNIIVASIYDNNGRKVFIGNKGRSWKRATEGGGGETAFQPVGYIKTTEPQEKFYREYTPEQWAEIQRQLEAKRDAAKAEIAPEPTPVSPAAATEDKLKPVGKATALEEKPVPLTESEASQIHDLVTKHVGGLPKSEDVREFVGDALAADPDRGPRLAKAAGQDYDNYLSILDQIYAVYDKAAQSGETDPAKLRETITRELAAIRPETSTGGEKPAQAPGPVVPKPEDRLATRSIGQDRNVSPEYQGRAQAVLQAHNGGSAFQALVDLSKSGLLEEDQRKLAEDLARYGEIGTSLATGGELRNPTGEVAYGKYSPDSNTISVYDDSFRDGAGVRSFLHEYVHSLTVLGIEAGRYSGELNLLYNLALETARKSGQEDHYGLTNASEFIAEAFTNPDFQNFLRGIPSLNMTLWDRFVNFIGNLLGIRDRTLLDDVLNLGSKYARWRVPEIRVQVPDYSRTVQWHTPASGSRETMQTYNAQTGKVEIAPLIPDSVESVLQNVTKPPDPPEYLLPSPGAPKIPERDLSVDHTNQHAMLNKLLEVLAKGIADAGSTLRGTLAMFGLMNPQTAKERLAFEESVKNLQHVERDKTLEGIRWDLNKNEVAVGALGALEKYRSKISTRVSRAKEEIPQLETRHQENLNEATETLQNLEDATALSNTINKGMAKIVDSSVRAYGKLGQQAGMAEQMYRDIEEKEGRPIDPNVVNIFRRLSKSDALTGEKMFDFLNQMANDPSLDFSQKASDIRDYIKHAAEIDPSLHRYTLLSANDAETKALLSTVIAYGKLNRRMLTLLQIRKMDGPDRVELKQAMEDQYKETTGQLKGGIRMVNKASALSERALAENRELLRQLTEAKRDLEHAQSVVYIGEKLLPHYAAEIDRITDKVKQTEDTTFGDGAVFRIPKTNELHPEWDELKLNLGITGTPTTTAELKSAFDKMTAWMKLRENDFDAGNDLAKGLDYYRVRQQVYAIGKQKIADPALRATDHSLLELFTGNAAKQMGALGTPVGKLIETAINKFAADTTNLRNQSDKEFGYRNQRLWNKVLSVLNQGQAWYQRSKVNGLWFDENIFDKALGFLERGQVGEWQDLKAAQDTWFGKMGQWLLAHDNIRPLIQDRMPQFMAAMRELADSIYMSGGWWVKKNVEAGMLVKDPSLSGRLRMHIDQGLWTFQRKFSNTFFGTIHAMRESGWAETREAWQNIATLMSQDPAKAEALVNKYVSHPTYGDTVKKALSALTHVPDASVIRSPVLDDVGTKVSAEPGRVAKAYDEANGNLIQMLLKLHEDYNGQDAQADYIQDELVNLADVFAKINAAAKKVEPQSTTEITTFVGLVPNAMIDARELKDLPPEWFNYHRFDNNDNARIAERTAWQVNMGREGRELANWHQRAQNDSDYLVHKLEAVVQDAKDATPSGRRRDIDREAARRLMADPDPLIAQFKTGQERLKFLRNVEKRAPFIQSLLRDMNTFFQRGTDSAGSLRWGIRMAGELASLLVNQPSAAIAQLATTVDIMAQWGLSPATLKATARTIQITGKDIAGSLAQGVGWEFLKPSYYEERAWKLGLLSPLAARRMGDIFGALTGEETNRAAKFFRQAKELQGLTINLTGERARYTPLQPLSPFFQFVTAANRGLLVSLAEMADGYVTKGVEFLRSHPGVENITGEDLGLNRFDRNSFEIWQKDHARYGLDFTDMVRGAKERMDSGDRTVITDKELAAINAVALNVISLESNIATMPLWAFNNSVVRFGLPLLGWSYRRAGQLAGLRLNTKDKMSLYAVSNAMLGVAATGLGGLGISLIVDAYSEDVLGKKRNIRSLRVPTTATDWQGIEERLAKVGTFGLWGELVNSAFNVGTGQGDNRMLSVDQRVVAMQSFQSLFRAISAYINQGFDPDYRNVVRPMVGALGGSGLLQYMQIINHAFDLDNVESRVVKRINAENYLRVVGRDLGMSIRTGGGGYGTPTPITPWIARMEFAAYANDPAQFRQAYNGAKAEAKSAGKEDPDTYVRQAFETRHPLRYVFSQVPSEREYRQILANLDDQGKDSVTEAVRLFNYYGQHIGVRPFEGSAKKDQARFTAPERAIQARLRAIGATP